MFSHRPFFLLLFLYVLSMIHYFGIGGVDGCISILTSCDLSQYVRGSMQNRGLYTDTDMQIQIQICSMLHGDTLDVNLCSVKKMSKCYQGLDYAQAV